jgi:hypothetical protein
MRQRDEDCTAQIYSTHPIDSEVRESAYQCRWSRPLRKPPRRRSSLGTVRRARVHRKSHELAAGHFDYPMVRLTGLWLEDAGFLQGQPYEVEVSRGKLVLRTV